MKKTSLKFFIAFVFVLILCISPYAKADWDEGDAHKMHYPQLPKALEGMDVALFSEGSIWLADDWKCSQTGPVSDIHFWVSWFLDDVQPIDGFSIRIWSDNPFGPNGWSEPNELLWERDFTANDITVRPMLPEMQGWFDPYWGFYDSFNHSEWAQVNITDITEPFIQQEGEVYWLMIDVWAGGIIGWKESGSPHFRDDAVYYDGLSWIELIDPETYESLDLAFVITGENLDFGDAPDLPPPGTIYPTLLANNGARHIIGGPWFGDDTDSPDAEPDGQPNNLGPDDDMDGNDDEDGIMVPITLTPGTVSNITLEVNGGGGMVEIWIDYNIDGDWDDAGEMAYSNNLPNGIHVLPINVPAGAVPGMTNGRFRISTAGTGSPKGQADDGEVEDNEVLIEEPELDFGDAPEDCPVAYPPSTMGWFPTCMWTGYLSWVQHATNLMWFGPGADFETNGNAGTCPYPNCFPLYDQDECFADGDAGLMYPEPYTIIGPAGAESVVPCPLSPTGTALGNTCQLANWGVDIDINVTNNSTEDAYVNVLMDWNHSGEWSGASTCVPCAAPEHVLVDWPVSAGYSGPLSADPVYGPPLGFMIGPEAGYVWTRFTITDVPLFNSDWTGEGVFDDGETEDYLLAVEPKPAVPHLKWSQPPIENDPMLEDPEYCGWNEESWTQDPCEVIPMHSVIDDFRCIGSMPVTSIHFWGSFIDWESFDPPLIKPTGWEFKFYANVPAPDDPMADPNYSHPGALLWKVIVPDDRVHTEWVGYDEYPNMPFETCFQHYVDLEPEEYFLQNEYLEDTNDNIFWLGIRAVYPDVVNIEYPWGWKTRPESWMDDAVKYECRIVGWEYDPGGGDPIPIIECRYWPIKDPLFGQSFDVAFELDTDPNYIKWEQPFTGIRDWPHYEDKLSMANIEQWTEQITKWSQKPDLEDINGLDIDATIEQTWKPQVLADDFPCEFTGPITNIDVWGSWYFDHPPFFDPNAVAFTLSIHKDIPASESPTGYSIPGELLWKRQFFPGEFNVWEYEYIQEGWFVPCAEPPAYDPYADNICFMYNFFIDPCDAFTQEEGNIYWLDLQALPMFQSDWQPIRFGWKNSSYEWNDNAVWAVGSDPPLGQWNELIYPSGHSRAGEAIDLAFAITTNLTNKWEQPPELQPLVSIDIDATKEEVWKPQVLADDFECTDPEPLTDIHIWASWYRDFVPWGDANNVTFTLSIHDDIPADENPSGYSIPGNLLWTQKFQPGDFDCSIYAQGLMEGWFVPCGEPPFYDSYADTICFQYDFYINRDEAFPQEGSDENPVTYWLDVQAQPNTSLAGVPPETIRSRLGWKTSWEHWNDDAVWAVGQDPPDEPWNELRYPIEHPFDGNSIDLAFEITGEIVHEELVIDKLVADDWLCERRTPVTAVAWFGSYLGYLYETPCSGIIQPAPVPPDHFLIAIYQDVPADDPDNEYPYSHPGRKLWQYAAYDYDEVLVGYDKYPEDTEGPREPVYRYSVRLPEDKWFRQREIDDVYWISIMAVYKSDVTLNHEGWGWTIHQYVWGDDAVQGYWAAAAPDQWVWEEILDQNLESADMSFILFTDPNECVDCADYNWDDIVNFFDYAIFALDWMWTGPAGGYANGDLNCSGKVDFEDLEIFCLQWLDSCP